MKENNTGFEAPSQKVIRKKRLSTIEIYPYKTGNYNNRRWHLKDFFFHNLEGRKSKGWHFTYWGENESDVLNQHINMILTKYADTNASIGLTTNRR